MMMLIRHKRRLYICLPAIVAVGLLVKYGLNPALNRNHTLVDVKKRHEHTEEVCRDNNFTGLVRHVTGSENLNITVCLLPKAGCTQWIRIFNYLAGQNRASNDPLTITKFEAHLAFRHKKFNFVGKDRAFITRSYRVMTVRHPFTRLWSAYIDKLVLSDFWKIKGRLIVKLVRENATISSLRCGNDVTFSELVTYLLRIVNERHYILMPIDDHWLPMSELCDPCQFKPDFIQKQETLVHDFNISLNKIGQKEVFEKIFSTVSPAEYEISEEIDYVFRTPNRYKDCATKLQMLQIIWKAFILNGYIPPDERFPNNISPDISKDNYAKIIIDVRKRTNMTSERTHYFRKLAREKAFSTLTSEQMEALRNLYKMDFLSFDYKDTLTSL